MNDPIKPNPLKEELHSAPTASNAKRDGESALEYFKGNNGQWIPIVIGGSALLIAAGYFLGRHYIHFQVQTPTERFLHDLQNWVEDRSSSLPKSFREKLNSTVAFLSNSVRSTPIDRVVSRFQSKPRRLFDLFS